MKAIISDNPQAKITGEPETVQTIDITHCQDNLKLLHEIAKIVNNDESNRFCETAKLMAFTIRDIENSL